MRRTVVRMKLIPFICLLAATALAAEEQDSQVIPSANTDLSVRYVWIADDLTGEAYIHTAILQRKWELPCSFSARGRAMLFSWSPDARYLLVGLVKSGKDMSLFLVDADVKRPRERDLELEKVEQRVMAALPERDPDRGESVAFASHHQVDFDRVKWLSSSRCQLQYISQFDRKAGEATLTVDLASKTPTLKIERITPRGPQ